jgi:subtilisin-like proprotein convertase family protein
VPQADHVTNFSPTGLTTAAYQWWASNIAAGPGPRNSGAARTVFGDLPPVAYEMADLRLPWAWELTGASGARLSGLGVKVAIIDDGIDRNHPDFAAGLGGVPPAVDADSAHHRNFFTNTNSPQPLDLSNDKHGTALAGIIGARQGVGAANTGIAGIAPRSTLQGLVAIQGFVDDIKWAESFAWGSTLADTDGDGNILDEARTGSPFCDVSLNAASAGASRDALDLFPESVLWHRAIRHGATQGRAGKGVVYITSAGNGADGHSNTNYHEQKSSIYQIPVTGVSDMGRRIGYANPGANIVCAAPTWGEELPPVLNWPSRPAGFPSNRAIVKSAPIEPDDVPLQWRRRTQGIPTLSTQAALDFNFTGTSASAAQVAGIVALMLEKRPDLTARDVKEILLRSCRIVNDVRYGTNNQPLPYEPNGPGSAPQQTYPWPAGGPHPPPALADGPTQWRMGALGRPLHHALGAGLIDAHRALKIAERWMPLPTNPFPPRQLDVLDPDFGNFITSRTTETGGIHFPAVNNALIPTSGAALEVIVQPPPPRMRLEHVEVRVRLFHQRRGDLEINLVAPGELAWDGAGRPMVSQLYVPHREDYTESRWHATQPELRSPTDWTFSTVRHWGTTVNSQNGGGPWKVVIRDAISKGATTAPTANDPVFCPKANPTDAQSQRIEGVAITYHGTMDSTPAGETAPWNPPVITSEPLRVNMGNIAVPLGVTLATPGAGPDGHPAFPVTSWDFFHLPDIVPVHAAAPAKSPFIYFPPGVSVSGEAPATALYPTLNDWPATPAWVPLTTPLAAPVTESSGAMVSRPRWAELSADGRFLVLRDPANTNAQTNFIYVRLNRASGVLDVVPHNPGSYGIHVVAENFAGISQPKLITLTVVTPDIALHDGDATGPQLDDGQIEPVNFGTVRQGSPLSRTFTISNSGQGTLLINTLTVPPGYSVQSLPPLPFSVAAGAPHTFRLQLDAAAPGVFAGQIEIESDDLDEALFNFPVMGIVVTPEITVHDGNLAAPELSDGQAAPVDFGRNVQGTPATRSFTITNTGTAELLVSSITVPAGFTTLNPPALPLTLAIDQSATFQVSLTTLTVGAHAGSVVITSDDFDETAFHFPITGEVFIPDPVASAVSTTTALNRQTGLREQTIHIANDTTATVPAYNLIIRGLPDGVEVNNASERREDGSWVVYVRQAMNPRSTQGILLEYFSANRGPADIAPQLSTEVILDPPDLSVPGAPDFIIDRVLQLAGGAVLIEFPTTPGLQYQVQYSHDRTNWQASLPTIRAAANRTQWTDRGLPRTDSHPSAHASRFYRVAELAP